MSLHIYAVTLNWNRPADTIACLESLAAQTMSGLHLVVVDNGSTDNSIEQIRDAFPEIELVINQQNAGFAGGMNEGIRFALNRGADAVFVLNNDTIVARDAIAHFVQHYQDGVGLMAPIIYYAAPMDVVWSVGGMLHPITLEVVGDQRGVRDVGQFTAVEPRDFVTGCGMFLSRKALLDVGLFDDQFFMYYEDSDLCFRLRKAGYEILLVPTAKMWHKVASSSGGSDSSSERYWMARSSIRFFTKYARWYQVPIILMWRIGSAIRTSWRLISHQKFLALRSYWHGLLDGFRNESL